jgi:hypothetical protein
MKTRLARPVRRTSLKSSLDKLLPVRLFSRHDAAICSDETLHLQSHIRVELHPADAGHR